MGNGQKNKRQKHPDAGSATELFAEGVPSEARQLGRRLVLKFFGRDMPELDRIEFRANGKSSKFEYLQKENDADPSRSFRAAAVTTALPIFFLDNLCARLQNPPRHYQLEGGDGSLAATLGYALTDSDGCWRKLFTEYHLIGRSNRYKSIFGGTNHHGKAAGQRIIFVKGDYLPPDCVEVYWNEERLNGLPEIQALTDQFRKAWNLPPPVKLELPTGEGEKPKPPPATPPPASEPPPDREETQPPKPPPVDPRLFQICNPFGFAWNDFDPLLNFGNDDSEDDIWRIKDASEGLLIFGSIGSGKTSGSGSAAALAMLQAGYGALILTAKPDEAARWLRLCHRAGRFADCVHVTATSGHKLNILQYESQRPGVRVSVTDDLIALFRCLLETMSHDGKNQQGSSEKFWNNATDEVMRNLFDLFQLAGEPLSIERMLYFFSIAPTGFEKPWTSIGFFAEMIIEAERKAKNGTEEDARIFRRVFKYWTKDFPMLYAPTRSGIYANFSAMAAILTGRGIYELVGTETNLTPEMILSGKIVILDFPLRGNIQGGLMVQAAWKLLFQQAVERRADKGRPTARPVVLWEDEGHLFFSHNDANFQPTARDCRAAHVIMSQNLHNFLHLGHNPHAVYSVFASMNTYIFHTNGDYETNIWASQRIGDITVKKLTTDGLMRSITHEDVSFFPKSPEEVKSIGRFSLGEETKRAMPPEDFSKLKKGGDGTCEAVVLWLSHQFACNQGKNFCVATFEQEPK